MPLLQRPREGPKTSPDCSDMKLLEMKLKLQSDRQELVEDRV